MARLNGLLCCATVLAGLAATAVSAEDGVGAAIFGQYCATCHGTSGKGDGPLTEHMLTEVPDLTGLSARNNGDFPMLDVIHIIDGRTGVRAHGGPMPVYGSIFMSEKQKDIGLMASALETRGRVLAVALHLESIQE